MNVRALDVLVGEELVGLLEQTAEFEFRFSFDHGYLRQPVRPVLGQFFEDLVPKACETIGHPPAWFFHLLPPHGPLRRLIAANAGLDDEDDEFGLLQWLGDDLPGAVRLRPGVPRLETGAKPDLPLHPVDHLDLLKFSLAGAQWKMSVREGERGLTSAVRGRSGHWIAKFHDPGFPGLPRVEQATSTWARQVGIDVPNTRLADVSEFEAIPHGFPRGDGAVFLIDRFDRTGDEGRIHIEDFAQVMDRPDAYEKSYEHLAAVLASTCREDLRAFCERLAFCIVAGNTDAHLKNWSLIYPDRLNPRLSPAYDLVASVLYAPERTRDRLAIPIGGRVHFEEVTVEQFRLLAQVADVDFPQVAEWVSSAAQRTRDVWQREKGELGFTHEQQARLDDHLRRTTL